VQTRPPFWGNPRFWLVIILIELALIAVVAPDYYVQGLHLLAQLFHMHLP
jgi:hypothetical protein